MTKHIPKKSLKEDCIISQRLQDKRIILGISQKKLALSTNVTTQQIQKYEKGINRISSGSLYYFAKTLGVDITYFFDNLDKHSHKASSNIPPKDRTDEVIKLIKYYCKIQDIKVRKTFTSIALSLSDQYK